jgi:ATP-dependent Lon protease
MAAEHSTKEHSTKEHGSFPILPLRDVVVYPHMVVPLFVGREKSILALEHAMEGNKQVVLVAQRDPTEDNPALENLYDVGTLASILQMLKLPDGTLKVLVEGVNRVELLDEVVEQDFIVASVAELKNIEIDEAEVEATARSTIAMFEQYVNLSKKNSR